MAARRRWDAVMPLIEIFSILVKALYGVEVMIELLQVVRRIQEIEHASQSTTEIAQPDERLKQVRLECFGVNLRLTNFRL
jgi:hypothetical protein